MRRQMQNYEDIDEYIANFPAGVQTNLQKLRQTIQKAAPEAKEKISYGIPTFTFHGNLVHFAAYDTHYGFYPGAEAIRVFKEELSDYETSKGTIRFPTDKPLPLNLVTKITTFCIKQKLNR